MPSISRSKSEGRWSEATQCLYPCSHGLCTALDVGCLQIVIAVGRRTPLHKVHHHARLFCNHCLYAISKCYENGANIHCTPVSSLNSTILCLSALVTLAIFRTQLFSHTCSLCCCSSVRAKVSVPYRHAGVTQVIVTLPFRLFEIRRSAITPSTSRHALRPACTLRRTSLSVFPSPHTAPPRRVNRYSGGSEYLVAGVYCCFRCQHIDLRFNDLLWCGRLAFHCSEQ